jgi:hypothetical protein
MADLRNPQGSGRGRFVRLKSLSYELAGRLKGSTHNDLRPCRRRGEDRPGRRILIFVIGGDGPKAEFTDAAMAELADAGVWPRR